LGLLHFQLVDLRPKLRLSLPGIEFRSYVSAIRIRLGESARYSCGTMETHGDREKL
jgi:hypothetical protein